MVHERYEKKCGTWSHKWDETKREVLNRHAKVCDQKVKVYYTCSKCGGAKTEKLKPTGHKMQPYNDLVLKHTDGYMYKVRYLKCANGCGHQETKQIGKKWKP